MQMLNRPGPHTNETVIIISAGSGHATVRWELARAGVLHRIYHYDAARMLFGADFVPKAGEFVVPADASFTQIRDIFPTGNSLHARVPSA